MGLFRKRQSSDTKSTSSSASTKSALSAARSNHSSDKTRRTVECSFQVGLAEDRNTKCRRTMEDAHTHIYNYMDVPDSGYFAIFDGHAGKATAEWCSQKLHFLLDQHILACDKAHQPLSLAFKNAFEEADKIMSKEGMGNSGSTAAVALLRWEPASPNSSRPLSDAESISRLTINSSTSGSGAGGAPPAGSTPGESGDDASSLLSGASSSSLLNVKKDKKRVLYTANVGDTRVVLCRGGKPLRLSYDHKGSDPNEAKRVVNLGGLVVNNRVSGLLAVTRSLGDIYLKELVCGSPYTTTTELGPSDEFMIIACDGLWDVCTDLMAVTLVRDEADPQKAAKKLVKYALDHFSSDNLTIMVVRFTDTK